MLKEIKPCKVMKFFEEISNIPRKSGEEDKIVEYLRKFAEDRKLKYYVDNYKNIVITKEASNSKIEEKMSKTINVYKENLAEIRAGRANPAVLNKIKIDYYGTPTPINQIAGISVPEARLIVIQPWDASALKEIEKAILTSDLGINPNNDGKLIRLNFPELNEERRKELVKEIRKMGEDSKVAIRSIRRDGIDEFKTMQKNSEITEDELKMAEDNIQKITDKSIEEIDKLTEGKEKEIMTV